MNRDRTIDRLQYFIALDDVSLAEKPKRVVHELLANERVFTDVRIRLYLAKLLRTSAAFQPVVAARIVYQAVSALEKTWLQLPFRAAAVVAPQQQQQDDDDDEGGEIMCEQQPLAVDAAGERVLMCDRGPFVRELNVDTGRASRPIDLDLPPRAPEPFNVVASHYVSRDGFALLQIEFVTVYPETYIRVVDTRARIVEWSADDVYDYQDHRPRYAPTAGQCTLLLRSRVNGQLILVNALSGQVAEIIEPTRDAVNDATQSSRACFVAPNVVLMYSIRERPRRHVLDAFAVQPLRQLWHRSWLQRSTAKRSATSQPFLDCDARGVVVASDNERAFAVYRHGDDAAPRYGEAEARLARVHAIDRVRRRAYATNAQRDLLAVDLSPLLEDASPSPPSSAVRRLGVHVLVDTYDVYGIVARDGARRVYVNDSDNRQVHEYDAERFDVRVASVFVPFNDRGGRVLEFLSANDDRRVLATTPYHVVCANISRSTLLGAYAVPGVEEFAAVHADARRANAVWALDARQGGLYSCARADDGSLTVRALRARVPGGRLMRYAEALGVFVVVVFAPSVPNTRIIDSYRISLAHDTNGTVVRMDEAASQTLVSDNLHVDVDALGRMVTVHESGTSRVHVFFRTDGQDDEQGVRSEIVDVADVCAFEAVRVASGGRAFFGLCADGSLHVYDLVARERHCAVPSQANAETIGGELLHVAFDAQHNVVAIVTGEVLRVYEIATTTITHAGPFTLVQRRALRKRNCQVRVAYAGTRVAVFNERGVDTYGVTDFAIDPDYETVNDVRFDRTNDDRLSVVFDARNVRVFDALRRAATNTYTVRGAGDLIAHFSADGRRAVHAAGNTLVVHAIDPP